VYDAERADILALEQLETVLRDVAEELATWRARALKAEADGKGGASRGAASGRNPELESENRQLRTRVDAARNRVQELLARLAFLEEQSREGAGSSGAAGGGAAR